MPLDFTNVQVPLNGGMDQKTDQRLLPPGRVTNLLNGVYTKLGSVQKRKGYSQLLGGINPLSSSLVLPLSTSLPPVEQLMTYKKELIGIDHNYLYSYSPAAKCWNQAGKVPTCSVTLSTVAETTGNFSSPDIAYCNGFIIIVWIGEVTTPGVGSIGNIFWMAIDEQTQSVIVPPTQLGGIPKNNGFNPKLATNGDNVVCVFANNIDASLWGAVISCPNLALPYLSVAPTQLFTDNYDWVYDVCADTQFAAIHLCYTTVTGTIINMKALSPSTLAVLHSGSVTPSAAPYALANSSFGVFGGSNYLHVSIGYQSASVNYLDLGVFNAGNYSTAFPFAHYHSAAAPPDQDALIMGVVPLDLSHVECVWNGGSTITFSTGPQSLGNVNAQKIAFVTPPNQTLVGPARLTWYPLMLSRPFVVQTNDGNLRTVTNGTTLVEYLGLYGSQKQGTQFIFDVGAEDTVTPNLQHRPVAAFGCRQSNVVNTTGRNLNSLANVVQSTANPTVYYTVSSLLKANLAGSTGRSGLQLVKIDYSPMVQYEWSEMGENLHFAGGMPSFYDGERTGDIGFAYYPEGVVLSGSNSGGHLSSSSGLVDAVYQYCFVYEWVDSAGQLHQSAPSIQQAITLPQATTSSVTITVPTMTITNKQTVFGSTPDGFFPSIGVAVYRSLANGTILYRVTPDVVPPSNLSTPLSAAITFTDTTADATIQTHATLYTEGGVLAYFNPPTAKHMTPHVQRLWLAGLDDPKALLYSNKVVPGQAMSFNDAFSLRIDDGGDITGIFSMDDNLIIFKEDSIYRVQGQGPNPLGQLNDLSDPIIIASDVGCINGKSIVLMQDGLMFQSSIGIHLLDRGFNVLPADLRITDLLQQYPTITSAVVHPTDSQVRFTCGNFSAINPFQSQGITLVYDYKANAWSYFQVMDSFNQVSSSMASSAVDWNGSYVWSSFVGYNSQAYPNITPLSGTVWQERTGVPYVDGLNSYIPFTVESTWVATNDIQGFQRVREVDVLLQQLNQCDLKISVATDYNPSYTQQGTWLLNTTSGQPQAVYKLHVRDQTSTSIRVKIEDLPPSFTPSPGQTAAQGLSIARITLRAGTKTGTQKVDPVHRQ